jgi:hypothetical protein
LISERLSNRSAAFRVILATLAGTAALNFTMLVYDGLYLGRTPGWLPTSAACLLIALGFSLGSLVRKRIWKIGISAAAFFIALAGSWWVHISLAASPTELMPLVTYEYTAPAAQVITEMLVLTLTSAVFANLVDLSYREE